jgi:hypothetical protein
MLSAELGPRECDGSVTSVLDIQQVSDDWAKGTLRQLEGTA